MTADQPLAYIPRIRAYYQALGYGAPYEWAAYDTVPFSPLVKPLGAARIGIVTTAAPFKAGAGEQGAGAPYNGAAKYFEPFAAPVNPEPVLGISHIAYDRVHTSAADQRSYFPLQAMQKLAAAGYIGAVAERFYGLPTNRSQSRTREDAAKLVAFAKDDALDGVVLVPNCPVCHQSVSIAAHALEAAGISTVVMGCARDIVERVGVPRLLFSNFPLGNAAGLPDDPKAQLETARLAVTMLEEAAAPRTTMQSPVLWSGAPDWQKDYSNPDLLSSEEIAAKRAEFDRVKAQAKAVKAQ
ncbi:glycine reductase [Neptunicoccus cionae]|uniref:glycine reductase n=1 Tax=Neptunicoccus cionae TaxID=2035344 RepID=UPI000C764842|nr:glycine reductase [Amylibacter cionae]PLS22017.1 glycine reductase [Amylibacter cionae]